MDAQFHYLFGPVPSRRLGLSLGVDLCPMKTCCLDCVFCQLGRTAATTVARGEWVPLPAVLAELHAWFAGGGQADCVTLSGSGEPTLHVRFGEALRFLRECNAARTALLSNGSLFHLAEVRRDAALADVVKVSLSAWDAASFGRVNRPHPSLRFDDMVAGYSAFRREFRGEMWIEVFLVPGLNAAPAEVARIAALCRRLGPDRVHLNTAVRPAAQPDVAPLPNAALRELGALFDPPAEVPSAWESAKRGPPGAKPSDAAILALLARHPTTAAQLAELQQLDGAAVQESLARLLRAGIIGLERRDGVPYYFSRRPAP